MPDRLANRRQALGQDSSPARQSTHGAALGRGSTLRRPSGAVPLGRRSNGLPSSGVGLGSGSSGLRKGGQEALGRAPRPRQTAYRAATGPRPDRVAGWAVALGVFLVLVAGATARADPGSVGIAPSGEEQRAPSDTSLAPYSSLPARP